jgi:hypothetical protein
MDNVSLLPELQVGNRVRMESRGKYSRGLEGRTGVVRGFGHTKSAVRVLLDGQKSPQTLHRGYLRLIADPGP